jgi:hypothetical protein
MVQTRRMEPSHLVAKLDIYLQNMAARVGKRKEYYDLRERARANFERIDISDNKSNNYLFIHVPKCGGTSVENQLGVFHGHRSATYFKSYDQDFFKSAFKFSLVRNPYDRLVSGFHYLRYHTTSSLNHKWVAENIGRFREFHEFAEALEEKWFMRKITGWKHFVPQWYFVCDDRFKLLTDYIGRLEDFDEFAGEVARRSNVKIRNEVHRASDRRPWREYYSDRARSVVADVYAKDFRIFGYEE